MSDDNEPCMCGTPFTCMADEHDRTVYESHQWTGGGEENRCARCFTSWDAADYACGDGPPLYASELERDLVQGWAVLSRPRTYEPSPPLPAEVALLLQEYRAACDALQRVRALASEWEANATRAKFQENALAAHLAASELRRALGDAA